MIGQSVVKDKLQVDVALSSVMSEAIQRWTAIYTNQASWLNKDITSLGLGAAIAGEIARAVTIEMEVELTGGDRATFLLEQYNRIEPRLRQMVEVGQAKGGIVFKPYVSGAQIAVDFVQADQFFPVAFDNNGTMTSAVFVDSRQVGDTYYTRLEFHQMGLFTDERTGKQVQGCSIRNTAYRSNSKDTPGSEIPLATVDAWKDLKPEAVVKPLDRPLFAYYRVPVFNNVDPASPLGISCYARCETLIEQADRLWSGLQWEFESGKRAIYVDELAFGRDSQNKSRLPDNRLFRSVQSLGGNSTIGDGSGEDLFHDWTPEFRDEAFKRGLNVILQRIEFNSGLSYGVISDPLVVEKTATEITAGKQRLQSTIRDNQKGLQSALDHLFYAMDVYATLYSLASPGPYKVGYDWDDSLIVDSEAQFSQDLRTVGIGAMPKVEFLVRNYGLTEAAAKKWIDAMQAEQPADFFQDGA